MTGMEVYLCGKAEKKQALLIEFTDNTRMNHIGLREVACRKQIYLDKEFSHFQYIFMHQSIRVLLFNSANELLFMGAEDKKLTGADGNKGRFWFLVGGSLEKGETFQPAAKRELT